MTKIRNQVAYPKDTVITDMDYVIGSDGDNTDKTTKNFFFGSIRDYLLEGLAPEVGGTLKYTEITNNTGTYTTPADLANSLIPSFTVLQYNIVVFTVNGNRYLLKKQNLAIGFIETPITNDDFITIIGFEKLGDGQGVLKGYNETTKLHEYYSLKSTGNDISIVSDNIVIDPKEGVNLGNGEKVYKQLNPTTKLHEFYNLISPNLTIEKEMSGLDETGNLIISTPLSATIPALYVNDLYIPTYADFLMGNTKGEGTLAKPFTNTINYTDSVTYNITANTAIQNALDGHPTLSYVGTGTRLAPQRAGQQIIIQNNNVGYTFTGNFSYTSLNLKIQAYIQATTTDWIVDMDNPLYFDAVNSNCKITIDENYILELTQSLGCRNSGNTDSTPPAFASGRIMFLHGDGDIHATYNGVNNLSRYIINGDGNFNDSGLHFQVKCILRADYQGIYFSKNNNRIDFFNTIQSGTFLGSVDIALKAFHQTGGQIRFFDKGAVNISSVTSGRTYGITFEPTDAGIGSTSFYINNNKVSGNCNYLFARLNNELVALTVLNSPSGGDFSSTTPGTVTVVNGLFENLGGSLWDVEFKNNVFSNTGIDFTKIDLTIGNNVSAINFIGNNVVETLVKHNNRADAISAGVPLYSAYLKTSGVAYPTTSGWIRDIVLPA